MLQKVACPEQACRPVSGVRARRVQGRKVQRVLCSSNNGQGGGGDRTTIHRLLQENGVLLMPGELRLAMGCEWGGGMLGV